MNRFDEAAKTWDKKQTSIDSSNACVQNLKRYVKLSDNAHILDYGCGTGFISFALKNDKNNIMGYDFSQGMVDKFNEKAKNLKNIKAIKHNINIEDIEKNKFDLFISSMTMHHIKDTKMFAKKAYDCLKKNSYVCINDLVKEDGTFHKKHNNEGVEHFGYEIEDLYKIFKDIGFDIIACDIVYTHERNDKKYPLFNLIAKK